MTASIKDRCATELPNSLLILQTDEDQCLTGRVFEHTKVRRHELRWAVPKPDGAARLSVFGIIVLNIDRDWREALTRLRGGGGPGAGGGYAGGDGRVGGEEALDPFGGLAFGQVLGGELVHGGGRAVHRKRRMGAGCVGVALLAGGRGA